MVAPAMAQQVYYRGHDGYRDRGPVDAVVDTMAATTTASSVSPEHGFVAKTADGTYANKRHCIN